MFGLDKLASIGLAPLTGGASLFAGGEDTVARIPIVGGLLGAETDSEKALLEKQKQLAEEAKKRQKQNEQARLNALGQQMLAFNPQNQLMAQMFGPDAAFTPQQFSQMASDPYAMGVEQAQAAYNQARMANPIDPKTRERSHIVPPEVQANLERAYQNAARQRQIEQQMKPVGPGPAPLRPMQPAPARRF